MDCWAVLASRFTRIPTANWSFRWFHLDRNPTAGSRSRRRRISHAGSERVTRPGPAEETPLPAEPAESRGRPTPPRSTGAGSSPRAGQAASSRTSSCARRSSRSLHVDEWCSARVSMGCTRVRFRLDGLGRHQTPIAGLDRPRREPRPPLRVLAGEVLGDDDPVRGRLLDGRDARAFVQKRLAAGGRRLPWSWSRPWVEMSRLPISCRPALTVAVLTASPGLAGIRSSRPAGALGRTRP
jgi:hypothetical protein